MGQNKCEQKGFFKKGLIDLPEQKPCDICGLHKTKIKTPNMPYSGKGKLNAIIFGESPGESDDVNATHFYGKSGDILERAVKNAGFNLRKDFWLDNVVRCRTTTVTSEKVQHCYHNIEATLKELKPKFIVLLGSTAVEAFMGDNFSKDIMLWRGQIIPDKKHNAFILPLFHPQQVLKNEKDKNLRATFERDLEQSFKFISVNQNQNVSDYWEDEDIPVEILLSAGHIIKELKIILDKKPSLLEIDFETNCLQPYIEGSKILSVSMCYAKKAISFPYLHKDFVAMYTWDELNQIKELVEDILTDPKISKMAHNMKFEHIWSKNMVTPWEWDSEINAHIIDNRRNSTNLNFQAYVNFGRLPYDAEVEKYKKPQKGEIFNRLETKVTLSDLLTYGGLDSLYGYCVSKRQMKNKEVIRNYFPYDLFHEGALACAEIQKNGIYTSQKHFFQSKKQLEKRVARINLYLNNSEEAKLFKKEMGRDIKWTSNKDLGVLYYDLLKVDKVYTKSGKSYCTDKGTLEDIDIPINKKLLEKRKYEKILSTYVIPFLNPPLCNKGYLHPSISLNIPISLRSSCYDPNFQNIPSHDEEANWYVRGGIIASPGNQLLEADFKGFEVSIGATYHKDPNMISYLLDKNSDMHRDVACDLLKMTPEQLKAEKEYKVIRFEAKNCWTFAEFYGDWYESCGTNFYNAVKDLILNSGKTVSEYLATQKVTINDRLDAVPLDCLENFLIHCKDVEDKFWKVRFKKYNQWRWDVQEHYRKVGYIENHFGFRFRGYMTRNEATNYPIQSQAFHCLLWTMIMVMKEMKIRGMKSKCIGQIHDSMVFDTAPEEAQELMDIIKFYGTDAIRKKFKWIMVPLEIEFAITPINGSWYQKEEIKNVSTN